MHLKVPTILFLLLLMACSAWAQQSNDHHTPSKAQTQQRLSEAIASSELEKQAEEMISFGDEASALKLWIKVTEAHPNNQRAMNKVSFLSARIGNRLEGEQQDKYFWQAQEYAEQSLALNEEDPEANFVMAVAVGRIAEVSPARERMSASGKIKRYASRALELDPEHAGAWHVLGLWHYRMSSMSVAEREAAKALYGEIGADASKSEAERSIKKAIALRPDYLLYRSDLARVYFAQGKHEMAKRELQTILKMHANSPDDEAIKEKARSKL